MRELLRHPALLGYIGMAFCAAGALCLTAADVFMPLWGIGSGIGALQSYIETFDVNVLVKDLDVAGSGIDIAKGLDILKNEIDNILVRQAPYEVLANIGFMSIALGISLLAFHMFRAWRSPQQESLDAVEGVERRRRIENVISYMHGRAADLKRKAGAIIYVIGALSIGGVVFLVHFSVAERDEDRRQLAEFVRELRGVVNSGIDRVGMDVYQQVSMALGSLNLAGGMAYSGASAIDWPDAYRAMDNYAGAMREEIRAHERSVEDSLRRHREGMYAVLDDWKKSLDPESRTPLADKAYLGAIYEVHTSLNEAIREASQNAETGFSTQPLEASLDNQRRKMLDTHSAAISEVRKMEAIKDSIRDILGGLSVRISNEVSDLKSLPSQVASEISMNTPSYAETTSMRIGGLVLLVLLVRFLVVAYKYSLQMSAFYSARKDALIIDEAGQAANIKKLVEAMSPHEVTFESGPNADSPLRRGKAEVDQENPH